MCFTKGCFTAKLFPPSGNKNNYASYSRYWWPDPAKADGLPYIRRDGETYPGSQSLTASCITTIAMMIVILLIDGTAHSRIVDYKEQLESVTR